MCLWVNAGVGFFFYVCCSVVLNFLFPIMLLEGNPMFKTGLYNPCFFSVCVCVCDYFMGLAFTVNKRTIGNCSGLLPPHPSQHTHSPSVPLSLPLPPISITSSHSPLTINFLPTLFSVALLSGETAGGFECGRDRCGGVRFAASHPGGSALLPQ